jgi:hypothetical protein
MYYLSLIASLKNETMNLKIWIEHYLWQGVEHFYLIDNGSDDNPLSILQEYIDNGIVTYYYLPQRHRQVDHYRYVFDNANLKNETYWLAVCDLDEFFFGVDKNLKIKLRTLEDHYDYILCNWKMFGSDGHETHPEDIRRDITFRKKDLWSETKYIFKPQIIDNSSRIWIHWLIDIEVKRKGVANVLIQLNHYPIQSLDFFQKVKMSRGDASCDAHDNVRDLTYFNRYDTNEYCDEILKNLIINPPVDYTEWTFN